jgi:Ribbon-helix-helix protein, copG family
MAKVTFSLDDEAIRLLRKTAERSRKPQSLIVREAIAQYAAREEKLSDAERDRLLKVLREIKVLPATRPDGEVDHELRAIRRARRTGWSRPVA